MKKEQLSNLMQRFPSISDLRQRTRRRIPHVAWEYLDCGTGEDRAVSRNVERMANVTLIPQFMKGVLTPKISTRLFGRNYRAPMGIAPVGLGGLMWPHMERTLARSASRYSIPYCVSTVAAESLETLGPIIGDMGWFQLYPPRDLKVRTDLLKRAKDSGFTTLVVTADVPTASRRERTLRAGLRMPPKITPRFIWEALKHPVWTIQTLKAGLPKLKTVEKYADSDKTHDVVDYVEKCLGGTLSWDYIKELREEWEGPLVIKGILHPEDAERAVEVGVCGIQVSNHGARQLDAVPAAIDVLPEIVRQVNGRARILFDSGVRSGLDIIRAIALGADFVFLGRGFIYGVAALGEIGGDYATELLETELKNCMVQLGCEELSELPDTIVT